MSNYIYLIAGDGPCKGFYKIGKAKNPAKRIKQFTKMPFGMQIAHVVKCDNANLIESKLHEFFSDKRVNGEWFTLDSQQVDMFTLCNDECDLLEMIGASIKASNDDLGGRIVLVFGSYLDGLRIEQSRAPLETRLSVPTIRELARLIRERHGTTLHEVTLANIINGHGPLMSMRTVTMLLDEMWYLGFKPSVTDFIKYIPPKTFLSTDHTTVTDEVNVEIVTPKQ